MRFIYYPDLIVIEVSEMSGFEETDDCSWQGVYILNRCYDQFMSSYPKEEETFA